MGNTRQLNMRVIIGPCAGRALACYLCTAHSHLPIVIISNLRSATLALRRVLVLPVSLARRKNVAKVMHSRAQVCERARQVAKGGRRGRKRERY